MIEKYKVEKNGAEYVLEVDKTNLDGENFTIKDNIDDEGASVTIENKNY